MPGLGWSSLRKLKQAASVSSVGALRAMSRDSLATLLGAQSGARLFRFARGLDDREVYQCAVNPTNFSDGLADDARPRRSIGVDLTYGVRFSSDANIYTFIQDVVKELVERMKAAELKGKKVCELRPPDYLFFVCLLSFLTFFTPIPSSQFVLTCEVMIMAKKRYPGSKPSVKSLGHGHCLTYNRSSNLSTCTDDAGLIAATATKLYKQLQIEPSDLR